MKKILLVLLATLMIFACACQDSGDNTIETELPQTNISESEPAETEAAEPEQTEAKPTVVLSPEMQQKLGGYIPKNWQDGIDEINASVPEDFMFAIQTDTHFSVTSGANNANCLKALSHFIPLSFYANLGDYIKGYYVGDTGKSENTPENTMQSLKELTTRYLEDANCPVLITFGNHDTNALWCKYYGEANQQLTQTDHYEQVTSKIKAHNGSAMVTDGESNYYYVDFPFDDVRVVMLNTTDGNYENSFESVSTISDRQAEWFETVALDTDMNVLVMAHIPLCKDFPDSSGSLPYNAEKITSAVEAFIKDGGKFVAYMYGHTHIQADKVDENGRLHISFANGGTKAEVVAVNFKAKKIYTFGLGGAEGRDFRY